MTSNLTLSRNYATCTSTWTKQQATAVEVVYTTPTWDYDNVTITVPSGMVGAVFNSVSISYTLNSANGTKSIKYSDTRVEVTNANLLERLQNGDTEITLLFSYKAAGGTAALSSTCRWTNIVIAADYVPSKVYGTATVGTSTVTYAIDKNSMTVGESSDAVFSINPSALCSSLTFEMRPTGQTDVITYTWDVNAPAGVQTQVQSNFMLTGITLAQHSVTADIRITLTTTSGQQQSSWITTQLKLIDSRVAPVIKNLTITDIGQSALNMYVQGKSQLRFAFSVDLDTAADPDVAIVSRSLLIGGESYAAVTNQFDVATDLLSDSVNYTVTVKDTYGLTATATGTIDIKPYFSPRISLLKLVRYKMKDKPEGGQEPVASDEGNKVWVTMTGAVAPCVTDNTGNNGWKVVFKSGESTVGTYEGLTEAGTFSVVENTSLIDWLFTTTETYNIAVTITDKFETVAYTVTVSKSGGIFSIEKGGVAVGKRATGTPAEPKFEVAYKTYFEKEVYDSNGVELGQHYVLSETVIGTYLDKKLYRKGLQLSKYPTSATEVNMDIAPTLITKIEGYVLTDRGDFPINFYRNETEIVWCRPKQRTGILICYTGMNNDGGVVFVEYTKE